MQRAVDAEPLQARRGDIGFRPADQRCVLPVHLRSGITPGVEFLKLVGLVHIGCGKRDADRVVGELVDEGAVDAIAVFARTGVERADIGPRAARADGDDLLAGFERADGADIDRADEALPDQRCGGRLVDDDLIDDFRRILVQLDRAVVARGRLFAAVQQRLGEIRAEAADRDHVGAPVQALRGKAGKARNRFPDRGVGQLADIFRRDRFHDLVGQLLFRHRAFEAGTKARHNDDIVRSGIGIGDRLAFVDLFGRGLLATLRHRGGGKQAAGQRQGCGECGNADPAAKRVAKSHFSTLSRTSPPWTGNPLLRAASDCRILRPSLHG